MNFMSLFSASADAPAPSIVAPRPFAERAVDALDALADEVRRASGSVSTTVFSQLRDLDDTLRPLIAHIAEHPVIVDREVEIEGFIGDFIPTPLRLFLELPPAQQADGERGERLLREQFETLNLRARALAQAVYDDATARLESNAIFVQNKFGDRS